VPHLPPRSQALTGLRWQAEGMLGLGLTAELPSPSRFTCLHTRLLWPPPFFGRPGVYQPVSKVTLVAAAGPTCNYAASPGDCCWVAGVLLLNLFLQINPSPPSFSSLPTQAAWGSVGDSSCCPSPRRDVWGCLQQSATSPCWHWAWLCFV